MINLCNRNLEMKVMDERKRNFEENKKKFKQKTILLDSRAAL